MRKKRWGHLFVLFGFLSVLTAAEKEFDTGDAVRGSAPGNLFLESEKLLFSLRLPPGETLYTVTDVYGKVHASGTWIGADTAELPRLPRGLYEIVLNNKNAVFTRNVTFSVLPPPAKVEDTVQIFGFDSAIDCSDGADSGSAELRIRPSRECLLAAAVRTGMRTVRVRTGWRQLVKDRYDVLHLKSKRAIAELMKSYGIDSAGCIEGPKNDPWRRSGTKIPRRAQMNDKFTSPDDLFDAYRYCKTLAATIGGDALRYCEYLNEPDLKGDPTWEVAAHFKAAALGFRAGDPKMRIMTPSFCQEDPVMLDIFLGSDTRYYFDVFNMHCYWDLLAHGRYFGTFRDAMRRAGCGDRAIFVSENGDGMTAMKKNPRFSVRAKKYRELSREQEFAQAEWLAKTSLSMQRLGISVNMIFYLTTRFEGEALDWGHFRTDHSARPSLTVQANLAHHLMPCRYLGVYNPAPGLRGMLYARLDGLQTLLFWSENDFDKKGKVSHYVIPAPKKLRTFSLPAPDGDYPLYDMYGSTRPAVRVSNGRASAEVSSMPTILTGVSGLSPQEPAPPRPRFTADTDPALDMGIVAPIIPGDGLEPDSAGHFAEQTKKRAQCRIELYNFDDKPKSGTLTLSGCRIINAPGKVTLPPESAVMLAFEVEPEQKGDFQSVLEVGGKFGGKRISRAFMPVRYVFDPAAFDMIPCPELLVPERWRPISSSPMRIFSPEPGVIAFRVDKFLNNNRWTAPSTLLKPGEFNLADTIGIAFETRTLGKVVSPNRNVALLRQKVKEQGNARTSLYRIPQNQEWHECRVFWNADRKWLEKTTQIRFGGSSSKSEWVEFQYRNIRFLKLKGK